MHDRKVEPKGPVSPLFSIAQYLTLGKLTIKMISKTEEQPFRSTQLKRLRDQNDQQTTSEDAYSSLQLKRFCDHPDDERATLKDSSSRSLNNIVSLMNTEGDEDALGIILTFFDVTALTKWMRVCKRWNAACTKVIDYKALPARKIFESNLELRSVVKDYVKKRGVDKIAAKYGWPIDRWDVSQIQDFSCIFEHQEPFNENIGSWNVSNALNMNGMFYMAVSFNSDLSCWDVSKVEEMKYMFKGASSFNNQSLLKWNTGNVKDMRSMFSASGYYDIMKNVMVCASYAFNQDLSSWDVSKVWNMNSMFYGASSFQQDISSWNISNVKDLDYMFHGATSFHQNLSSWEVSNEIQDNMKSIYVWSNISGQRCISTRPWSVSENGLLENEKSFDVSMYDNQKCTFAPSVLSLNTASNNNINTINSSSSTRMKQRRLRKRKGRTKYNRNRKLQ